MTWQMSKSLDRITARWPMGKRMERQAQLMGEVMDRVAVDVNVAARESIGIAFGTASRRCMLCRSSEECRQWLDEGGGDAAPAFCPNAAFFNNARASMRTTG